MAIIELDNVSMAYPLYRHPADLLKEVFLGGIRHDLFWALRDLSLCINEGERVGVIGPNGAGKSTLLQIVAGTLTPSHGTVKVEGDISALLSLVPTWSLEETGLDNIRFNLMLKGCTTSQIDELCEEIVDFTELGPFIHQPVRQYSAGMGARLSFAIATAIAPDVLIIDEVLGAGDGYFASKAMERMRQLCNKGKALLFVSHSVSAIRMFCNRAVWLENGVVRMAGLADHVTTAYERDVLEQEERSTRAGNVRRRMASGVDVCPEDIAELDSWHRVRIRSVDDHGVAGYFVRRVVVRGAQLPQDGVVLDPSRDDGHGTHEQHRVKLDAVGCEWGRSYELRGLPCRLLVARTGARKGGHLLLHRDLAAPGIESTLEVVVEWVADEAGSDALTMDALDVESLGWTACREVSSRPLEGDWCESVFETMLPVAAASRDALHARLSKLVQAPALIRSIEVHSNGVRTRTVAEGEPFKVRIAISHLEPVPASSVNLNISRLDGVYAFYQPSGWEDGNIVDFKGDAVVEFSFDPNPFGAGEYEANVFLVNGWSDDNIPPSDIFDKRVGDTRFVVTPVLPCPFGLVNLRVPVSIVLDG